MRLLSFPIGSISGNVSIIKSAQDPTTNINPPNKGTIWVNTTTGEIFVCVDNTPNKNVWKGCFGKVVSPITFNTVDVFGDGSCIAFYRFDSNLNDDTGQFNASKNGNIQYDIGIHGNCVQIGDGAYIDFVNTELPYRELTVSLWVKAPRRNQVIINFFDSSNHADLYYWGGDENPSIGLNTWNMDCYGDYAALDDWTHIVAVFNFDALKENFKLYINGEVRSLKYTRGSPKLNSLGTVKRVTTFSHPGDTSQLFQGCIDQLRIFNRALSDEEAQQLYNLENP